MIQGRVNHYRISQFILLFFYKNILYTLPQLIYGYFSYFSGISLFDDWYLVLYNLLFTTVTVSYIGAFDLDVTYWKIKDNRFFSKVSDFFSKVLTCGAKKNLKVKQSESDTTEKDQLKENVRDKQKIIKSDLENSETSFEVQKTLPEA